MTRLFGQNVSLDMLVLWAIETLACFLALYATFNHGHLLPVVAAMQLPVEAAIRAANITILLGAICIVLGLYKPTAILQTRMLFITMAVAALFAVPIFWIAFTDEPIRPTLFGDQRVWQLKATACWLLLLVGTRLVYASAVRNGRFTRNVIVVGDGQSATDLVTTLRTIRPSLFTVTSASNEAAAAQTRPWRIVTTGKTQPASPGNQTRVVDVQTFWETQFGRIDLRSLQAVRLVDAIKRGTVESTAVKLIHRAFDIAAASVLLLLAAPLMLLTALAVKLDSHGPVIYSQSRVGLGGRLFTILKFRSMRNDAERDGIAVWASVRDSRVTRVGAFIRKVRIDELPQLVNILRGDMSLVGPRPERPALAESLNAAIPHFSMRTMVKPGLTGWAQINSAYTASTLEACEKLSYDLYYVKNRTLALDIMIVVATIRILIFQVGSR